MAVLNTMQEERADVDVKVSACLKAACHGPAASQKCVDFGQGHASCGGGGRWTWLSFTCKLHETRSSWMSFVLFEALICGLELARWLSRTIISREDRASELSALALLFGRA